MNLYSLRFENSILENHYILYQNKQQIQLIKTFTRMNMLIVSVLAILCGIKKNYITLGITLVSLINIYLFYKNMQLFSERNLILLYEFTIIVNPYVTFIAVYFESFASPITINSIIWIIIQVSTLVITSNMILATIQLINGFIVVFMLIHFSFGFTLYNFIWIPLFLYCIYTYFIQIKNKRLLFKESQVNQSIYTLIKETNSDDIMYFSLNKDSLKYELEFTNMHNLDLSQFLSSVIIDRCKNLKEFLFSKITDTNQTSTQIQSMIGYNNFNERIDLDIYIQYYPQLKFYVRLKKDRNLIIKREEIQEIKLLYNFYRKLINKIQIQPIDFNLRNLINYVLELNAQMQLHRIVQNPNSYKFNKISFLLDGILYQFCKNLSLNYQLIEDSIIFSNKVAFETLLYLLLRIIKQKNNSITVMINNDTLQEIQITICFATSIQIELLTEGKLRNKLHELSNILSSRELKLFKKEISFFLNQSLEIPFC